jgi:uncharacterized membrane protein
MAAAESDTGSGEPPQPVVRNIAEVVRLEHEAAAHRPPSHRVAEAVAGFAGTPGFVALHLAVVTLWALANIGMLPGVPVFDPFPFSLLGSCFSLEGVLLAAVVLIRQNRMSARAEERSHLDLQISLLAEQEVTKVIQMLERVSAQLGIEAEVVDQETKELGEATAVGGLAKRLHEQLPEQE